MTYSEITPLIRGLADGTTDPFTIAWGEMSSHEIAEVLALVRYEIEAQVAVERRDTHRKKMAPAQKRAFGLFLSLLSSAQRAEVQRTRRLTLRGSAGGWYRLWPSVGQVQRVERHRSRWYRVTSYCLHDPENELPSADVSVGHLLLLLSDESTFLALANATDRRSGTLWNGNHFRHLRDARLAQRAA